jgi:CheY-like chemotaxis protein
MRVEPLCILLAEDDEGHAQLIRKNLSRGGLQNEVIHVSDGQLALDYIHCEGEFASRTPQGRILLLLDIKMPRVDGIQVLEQLKSDPRTDKIPVIMLTTTDDPREIERCYEIGCSAYITKPVAYDAFVEAIRRLGLFLQVVTVLREDQL